MSVPLANRAAVRRAMFGVFLAFAVNGIVIGGWISRLPAIRDALGLDTAQVGVFLAGMATGAVLGLLGAAAIVHRFGARRTILLSLGLGAVGLLVLAVGVSVLAAFPVALVGGAVFGVAWSICDVAMNVEGTAVERDMGRTLMPWFHAAWSLGSVAGAGTGAVAAFLGIVPGVHIAILIGVVLVTAAIVPRLLPHLPVVVDDTVPAHDGPTGFRAQLAAWREPRILLLGLLVLGMAFAEGSANDWLALAMKDDRGFDDAQAALLFGVFTAAMTIGRIAGVPLLDRYGRVPVLRAAVAMAAVGLAIVILVPYTPVMIAGIVIWGLGASLGFPVGMSAAGDDPHGAAARVSAVATIAYCAFLVGPPVLGLIGHQVGILNSLWIVFGLIVLAAVGIPAARERTRSAGAERARTETQQGPIAH